MNNASIRLSLSDPARGIELIALAFEDMPETTAEQLAIILECMNRIALTLHQHEQEGAPEPLATSEPADTAGPEEPPEDSEGWWNVVAPAGSEVAVAEAAREVLADPPDSPGEISEAIAARVPGARVGPLIVPDAELDAFCWCGAETLGWPRSKVRGGDKPSCGAEGCDRETAMLPRPAGSRS